MERDLELERRKVRELQDGSRERDKEYAKLKVSRTTLVEDILSSLHELFMKAHFDKLKRKALFGPGNGNDNVAGVNPQVQGQYHDDLRLKAKNNPGNHQMNSASNLNAIVGGMEANGV